MFAICLESSHARGMGHLFRVLNLAQELEHRGHSVTLLVNEDEVALRMLNEHGYTPIVVNLHDYSSEWESELIERHGFSVWINDRLDTDEVHVQSVNKSEIKLATFDDHGSGAAFADLHIAGLNFDKRQLSGKKVLYGVNYLILNQEIARYQRLRQTPGSILVTLGGSDTYGVTIKVVEQLTILGLSATVVVGPTFRHFKALDAVLNDDFDLRISVQSMAEEMSRHELAITGGGITPFEANAAGLPCLVIANEDFEIPVCQELERLGGAIFVGHHNNIDLSVMDTPLPLENMSRAGMSKIGLGGLVRVADALEGLLR